MPEYRVTWEIEVEADDEISAAQIAKFYQTSRIFAKNPSPANVFHVTLAKGRDRHTKRIDLDNVALVRR
jgi:tRNA nucleotidyltransferase (CCA-adding enzyme)